LATPNDKPLMVETPMVVLNTNNAIAACSANAAPTTRKRIALRLEEIA